MYEVQFAPTGFVSRSPALTLVSTAIGDCAEIPGQTDSRSRIDGQLLQFISAIVPGSDSHFLKGTTVHPVLVFQVQGDACRLSRWGNIRIE